MAVSRSGGARGIEAARKNGVCNSGAVRFDPDTIRTKVSGGMSQAALARELGCDVKTVQRAMKEVLQ